MRVVTPVLLALLLASAAVAVTVSVQPAPSGSAPAATTPVTPEPSPPQPAPRAYPRLPRDPAAIASQLAAAELALRTADTPAGLLGELGHRQQVIYRRLATDPPLAVRVRAFLPVRWQGVMDRHLAARREFLAMHRGGSAPVRRSRLADHPTGTRRRPAAVLPGGVRRHRHPLGGPGRHQPGGNGHGPH